MQDQMVYLQEISWNESSRPTFKKAVLFRDNLFRLQSGSKRKDNSIILKDGFISTTDPSFFTSIATELLHRQNETSFPSIRINKSFSTPIKCISKVRFKFWSQIKLLPPLRSLKTFTVETSIINRVTNVYETSGRSLIHSEKKVGTRMALRTPALIRHSWKISLPEPHGETYY